MRLLCCGSRTYRDRDWIWKILDIENRYPIEIATGGAPGADALVAQVAKDLGITVTVFPADWKRYGRKAGPIRNAEMLREFVPDRVFAFNHGTKLTPGTRDMVERAEKAGVIVYIFREVGRWRRNSEHVLGS